MTAIELIYDTDCPNVKEARAQLLLAFNNLGLTPNSRNGIAALLRAQITYVLTVPQPSW